MKANECEICKTRFKYALDKLTDVYTMAVFKSMMETKYECSLVTLHSDNLRINFTAAYNYICLK